MFDDFGCNLLSGFQMPLTLVTPWPTRMQNIPPRTQLVVSSFARIVVPEAVHKLVPERGELRNKKRLAKRYPDVLHHEETAVEVS